MAFIGRFKIGRMTPKPNFTYPVVRLPTDYAGIIGQYVAIYETKDEAGKRAFMLVLDDDDDSILPDRVAQRNITRGIENRLSVLEIEMKGIRKSLESIDQMLKSDSKRSKLEAVRSSKTVM